QDITPERVLELLPHGQVISSHSTKVVQIPHDLVVKYGHFVKAAEAQSIMLVSENTSIPVPSVLLVFKKEHDTYIVMRLIRGRTLQDCWEELSNPLREEVLDQFTEYVTELRFLSSEGHTPGPLDGGKCEGQWWTQYGAGPFKTYQDLLSWLNRKLSQSSRTHPLFSDEYPLVFTHQDLCPMNLILDDSNKLWVMDWGMAGWYPAYFEYACVKSPEAYMATRTGWISAALPRLPNYEAEASKLEIMRFALTFLPFC
ncbi:kinase-like protein, partial [Gloeophyllum trabeum ATCC 11539]